MYCQFFYYLGFIVQQLRVLVLNEQYAFIFILYRTTKKKKVAFTNKTAVNRIKILKGFL